MNCPRCSEHCCACRDIDEVAELRAYKERTEAALGSSERLAAELFIKRLDDAVSLHVDAGEVVLTFEDGTQSRWRRFVGGVEKKLAPHKETP